jgi:ribonucleoside-diphosphate reductase beta chain
MPLNARSPAMVEYHKAKRLHWDPQALSFTQDRVDWEALTVREQEGVLQTCALFLAGEEAVTHDLAPLLIGLRQYGGRVEEELFLTVQLYEEAKHFEFFDRWLSEVVARPVDFAEFATPSYQALFYAELPEKLNQCLHDHSPLTLAQASACYHMVIEGVLAETGYYSFARSVKTRGVLPGLLQGVQLVQRDEARHIAFGLHLIASFLAEFPDLWPQVLESMNRGLMLCTGALAEAFERYPVGEVPFGLDPNDLIEYASRQFSKRYAALERIAARATQGEAPGVLLQTLQELPDEMTADG